VAADATGILPTVRVVATSARASKLRRTRIRAPIKANLARLSLLEL